MLTLFSVPKPFVGEVAVLQENAIGSWTRLGADCEVILFGDEAGIAQAASRFATRYVPEIARNASGTPILSDVVTRAEKIASHPILCFVNTDMILFDDIDSTARAVAAIRASTRGRRLGVTLRSCQASSAAARSTGRQVASTLR